VYMYSSCSRGTWDVVCQKPRRAHRAPDVGDQRRGGQADGAAAAFPRGARRPHTMPPHMIRVAQLVAPIHTRSVAAGASTAKSHEGGSPLVFPSVAAASSATTRMSPSSKWNRMDSSAD
jgi:hypothetical protein